MYLLGKLDAIFEIGTTRFVIYTAMGEEQSLSWLGRSNIIISVSVESVAYLSIMNYKSTMRNQWPSNVETLPENHLMRTVKNYIERKGAHGVPVLFSLDVQSNIKTLL